MQSLTLPAIYDNIYPLCTFAVKAATQLGFDDNASFQLQLACDEACTNIIEHAYGDSGDGDILISWQVDDMFFTITLFDTGQPFTPDAVAQPSLPASDSNLENLQVGGLGLSMIRKMMDEVIFQFENAGNTLLLKKRLPTKLATDT